MAPTTPPGFSFSGRPMAPKIPPGFSFPGRPMAPKIPPGFSYHHQLRFTDDTTVTTPSLTITEYRALIQEAAAEYHKNAEKKRKFMYDLLGRGGMGEEQRVPWIAMQAAMWKEQNETIHDIFSRLVQDAKWEKEKEAREDEFGLTRVMAMLEEEKISQAQWEWPDAAAADDTTSFNTSSSTTPTPSNSPATTTSSITTPESIYLQHPYLGSVNSSARARRVEEIRVELAEARARKTLL